MTVIGGLKFANDEIFLRFDGSQYNIECITQLLTESLAVDIIHLNATYLVWSYFFFKSENYFCLAACGYNPKRSRVKVAIIYTDMIVLVIKNTVTVHVIPCFDVSVF